MPLTNYAFADLITFTRSTTGTFVGSNGLIQSAAIDAPRFDFSPVTLAPLGLLIEEQRVNLFLYSAQFDNAAWVKGNSTVTANATTSPDGTANADKLVENTATSTHQITQQTAFVSGTTYTWSFFVKAAERSVVRVLFPAAAFTSNLTANFDLATGAWRTASPTPSAALTLTSQNAGNGWYRITASTAATASVNQTILLLMCDSPSNTGNYTGDGTSGVFIWGAQLEAGAFPTSYIPTVASTVTRAADVAVMTGTQFSPWYNQNEGTIIASWSTTSVVVPTALGVFGVSDGTANERIQIRRVPAANEASFIVVDGGVVQYNTPITASSGINISALAYRVNDFISANNGTLGAADLSGTLPTPTQAEIGFGQGLTYLNGHLRNVTYYPTRLTDAQLQALTA
jgi:hypothetical protein